MADFEQAGATERLRRVAILREMLAKLKRSQAEALGVAATATPAEVRSAFMALTKQYHPTKFARLDEATVKLANEVFLQLREAYETLSTAGNRRARTLPGVASDAEPARKPEGAVPPGSAAAGQGVRVPDRASTAAGHAAAPSSAHSPAQSSAHSSAHSPGQPTVRIPDRSGDRAAAPPSVPAANTNSHATSTANGPPARPVTRPVTRPLIGGSRAGAGAAPPTRPSAPSISTTASSATPAPAARQGGSATGAPPTRPSAPSISASMSTSASTSASPSTSTSASPGAAGARPSAVPATGSGKVAAPSSSASSSAGGPRIRFGGGAPSPVSPPPAPSAISQSQPSANPHNNAEHARIRGLISRQKWTEARDALQLLLLRAPTDRGSMANLAYVRAREALELGNVSEARRELLRALAIEPTMEPARTTLREINDVTPSSAPRR